MKAENPIDLGKLQAEVRKAEALAKSASVKLSQAYIVADRAAEAKDRAKKKFVEASQALDKAKRDMLEAARTVANG